jgi:pimeloyl-ACP methyl ester carboxylesterase
MQVIVNGLLTCYKEQGSGKAVVLLHGWGDNSSSFDKLSYDLSKKYRVISLDLPGFGGTQTPNEVWGLDEYAKFVSSFLGKVNINSTWALIGHSNGGSICIRGVSKGWLNPERLVLMASAGIRGTQKGRMKLMSFVAKTGKTISKPLPESTRKKLRSKLYSSIGSDMLIAESLQESFKKIVADDVRSDAKQLMLPTLLIYGEKDEQTPLLYGKIYHELIADSTLEVLPGVGHFVFKERPVEVLKSIEVFLT